MNKILDRIFNTSKYSQIHTDSYFEQISALYLSNNKKKNSTKIENNRTLIIVPGYSVNTPPRIGHHLYYINALKYDSKTNPLGYKRIYLFDIYSKKNGLCNFDFSIPQLAKELMATIDSDKEMWEFQKNGEIDFIGASMGGLIVRKFIHDYLIGKNLLITTKWGKLKIKNIVLIATPNKGCKLVDKLENPIIQFILRIIYGKNNFAKSSQFKQISSGNIPLFNKTLNKIFKKKSTSNPFLEDLNSKNPTPGDIHWVTIRGTKSQWLSKLIYDKEIENDGVIDVTSVPLDGAENITDIDLGQQYRWNHRDLYMADEFCYLLAGILNLELSLNQYKNLVNTYEILQTKEKMIVDKIERTEIYDISKSGTKVIS
ncbi:MAG: hypothetical protein ACFFDW_06070 [Candidatus Thorarchaeota archaeon]